MKTLTQDFQFRNHWTNNRASAIYPLDLKFNSDFKICFLNYWKIKNKLNKIFLILTIYNQLGKKVKKNKINIKKNHYEISIAKIIKFKDFKGIVEIEFFSKDNIWFPFPAITGFYVSPNYFISGVHSAGRILNKNEIKKAKGKLYNESNFSLKFSENNITPFFSYFNSSKNKKKNYISVQLQDKNKNIIKQISIDTKLNKPYENKIFYLEDYFESKHLKKSFSALIKINAVDIFPRLVCGNYHKNLHHYEVTHSYGEIKNKKDFINNKFYSDKNVEHMSIMPFIKPKELKLKLRMFPTSLKSKLKAKIYVLNKKNQKIQLRDQITFDPSKKGFDYEINDKISFGFMSLKQKKIPSRLNTTYIYYNNNTHKLSTDIAAGFKSIEFPIKKNHWGSAWVSKDVNSKILIRRTSFFKEKNLSQGILSIYGKNNFKQDISIKIKNNDFKIIDLKKIVMKKIKNLESFSWILNIYKNPSGVETFWTSYNKSFICGEHGF